MSTGGMGGVASVGAAGLGGPAGLQLGGTPATGLGATGQLSQTASTITAGTALNAIGNVQGLDFWVVLLLLAALGRSGDQSGGGDALAFLAGLAVGMQVDAGLNAASGPMGIEGGFAGISGMAFDAMA